MTKGTGKNRTGKEEIMSVNGITSTQAAAAYSYSSTSAAKEKTSAEEVKSTKTAEDTGVIYERNTDTKTSSTKKTYKPDTALINKLKADADARTSQLRSLVEKIMGKQADTYGNANDIWSFLRSGNYTVDPATKAQAQADIAEDGYWGVNQTSDRIIQFATALTGGDPDKIESMREAFKKGYAQAEKTWGGSLPEFKQKTADAVKEWLEGKQADTYGNANDIWSFLRSGNYTVDPATKAQAQADIAEDGYWGVNQTSDRIIQFATALTGGDPDKIESMREAFKKGYAQAEKTWGGSLPEISQKTYDAVMEKFDKLAADAGLTTEA